MIGVDPQPDKASPFLFRLFPVMPYAIPEPVPDPTVQVSEFVVNVCHSEVIYPSSLYLIQFFDPFVKAHRSGFAGNGFELLF